MSWLNTFFKDRKWNVGQFIGRRCVIILRNGYEYCGLLTSRDSGLIRFTDDVFGKMCVNIISIELICKEKDFNRKVNRHYQEWNVRTI